MPFTIPLAVKIIIIGLVYLIHHFKRRKIKGLILAGLIFLAIPTGTPDDWLAFAFFGSQWGLPGIILYYTVLWIIIFCVWKWM